MLERKFIGEVDAEIRMGRTEYDEIIFQLESKHRQEMDSMRKQHALLQVKYDNLLKATKAVTYCLSFEKET